MLTKKELSRLLDMLSYKVIVEETQDFPYRITHRQMGYSDDGEVGRLQAKLSIMLEVAASKG